MNLLKSNAIVVPFQPVAKFKHVVQEDHINAVLVLPNPTVQDHESASSLSWKRGTGLVTAETKGKRKEDASK